MAQSDKSTRSWRQRLARAALGGSVSLGLGLAGLLVWLETGPAGAPERTVRDVTQLIAIDVERVATPHSLAELRKVVAHHEGPLSIGGGRFSMGGQIATDDTLFIDMREMNEVLEFDVEARTAVVEAGATWRDLLEASTPHGLAPKIMQSYANFTVGGSLSVNAHGRYVNQGPLVHSVRSLDLVLADGSVKHCSREENSELFWAAVGGYGAVGVIAQVELDLAQNQQVKRTMDRMGVDAFLPYFQTEIQNSSDAVFFNADLYPPDYDDLVAITFSATTDPLTEQGMLQEQGSSSTAEKAMYWWVSEGPMGKQARSEVIDRLRLASEPVVWRSYEASYDTAGLDPGSRAMSTYVLQEYFIPVGHFDAFVPKMREVFQKHDVNVVNVSIRHASAEPDSLLTWAPEECFAFVVYHKMGTSDEAWKHAETWTREMADAILSEHGTWYLPYQIHPTPAQFHQGYPRAKELFALKAEVDPDYVFRNRLWDAYNPPPKGQDLDAIRSKLAARETYKRPEDQTFLTLPEWYIVYSADELGAFLQQERPSGFAYFGAIGQFWNLYRSVWGTTRARYDFNAGYHFMIGVIGASFTVEYAAKGAYEHTLGRLFENLGGPDPLEGAYAQLTTDYGAFIHHTPWYAYPFGEKKAQMPSNGGGVRGLERAVVTWVELTAKQAWGGVIGGGTAAAYEPQAEVVEVWLAPGQADLATFDQVEVLETLAPGHVLATIPRYEPFTATVKQLTDAGVELVEVAGGQTMLVQVRVAHDWAEAELWGDVLVEWPMLTDPTTKRVALEVPIRRLDEVLPALQRDGVVVERLYDY